VAGPEVESLATLNRSDVEVQLDLRPPVLERTFDAGFVKRLLRHDVKHTIEPELTYRYVNGVNNFQDVLRFDAVDVASNTNEIEYGATQRLFLRRTETQPCRAAGSGADATEILGAAGGDADAVEEPGQAAGRTDDTEPVCGNREWISWRLAQKYFFDPNFGEAVVNGRRNILGTTLDFSGIAFLTEPRNISPLLSRLRVRTSEKTDVEWDFDYDTGAKKFTANNIYVDVHQGLLCRGELCAAECAGPLVCGGSCVQRGGLQPDADDGWLREADQGGIERGGQCGDRSGPGDGAVWRDPGLVQLELLRSERGVSQV